MIRIPHPLYEGENGGAGTGTGTGAGTDGQQQGTGQQVAKPDAGQQQQSTGQSLLNNNDGGQQQQVDVTALPANWRAIMSGGNADVLKELERFEPAKLGEAVLNYKKQMRNGSLTTDEPAPDGEKQPDALKAWRTARGIPLTVEGYKIDDKLTAKLQPTDKPLVDDFVAYAHKANMPPSVVNFGVSWYTQMMENVATEEAKVDKQLNSDTEEALRGDWGPAYKTNMAIAKRAATEMVPGINFLESRLPDGRLLGSVPEFIKAMVDYGLTKWGDGSLIGEENIKRAEGRKKEIENIIQNEPDKYTAAMRQEYFDILNAEEKAKGKRG
jgi:hypothetical protein